MVNRLPLDNATLKLQHHGVVRRLTHRKDKRCVCGTRGQGQQSILVTTVNRPISDEKVLGKGLLHPCKGAAATCGRCSKTAGRLTPPEAINVKMSFIEPIMRLWQPKTQIWIWWTICCLGIASGDGLPLQEFQVYARTKRCNSRNNTTVTIAFLD